ncbi:MAG: hypothetical protein JSV86_19910 [Gemmatimonadota bacterium]|nr:MAG: hypothetical protein JSV86_19910 [Gemmatimonadota bacterium]
MLRLDWGNATVQQIARRFERDPKAVYRRALNLGLIRAGTTLSINAVARRTGYAPLIVRRALKRLDWVPIRGVGETSIRSGKPSKNTVFLIPVGLLPELYDALREEHRYRPPTHTCPCCGTAYEGCAALRDGTCRPCYARARRRQRATTRD